MAGLRTSPLLQVMPGGENRCSILNLTLGSGAEKSKLGQNLICVDL
jgi:hypothetical protein